MLVNDEPVKVMVAPSSGSITPAFDVAVDVMWAYEDPPSPMTTVYPFGTLPVSVPVMLAMNS